MRWGRWQSGPFAQDLALSSHPSGGPPGMHGPGAGKVVGVMRCLQDRWMMGSLGLGLWCPQMLGGSSCLPMLQGKGHSVSTGVRRPQSHPVAGTAPAYPPARALPGVGSLPFGPQT